MANKEFYNGADERFITDDGFVKVSQDNGLVVVGIFWNPETNETKSKIIFDEDSGCAPSEEYRWPLFASSDEIAKAYKQKQGIIEVGDTIEVFKGRKFPIGSRFVVKSFYTWYGDYGQSADYVISEGGERIPRGNVKLVVS